MKKVMNKKYILPLLIFILITFLYFCIPMIVMPDSTEYYDYLKIFYGVVDLSEWNVVRGFGLPLVLFISTKLFGNTVTGLLIGSYISYMLFNILAYILFIYILKNAKNKFNKTIISLFYFILILFNPILFGYFHGLLTEFVAITLCLYACVFSYKFLQHKPNVKNIKTYIYLFIYILLFVFCWFLKQPYFTIALFPFLLVLFISIFKYKSIKDFMMRFSMLIICVLVLVISISSWKQILVNAGVDYDNGRNNEHFLKEAVINGISNFRIEEDISKYNVNSLENDPLIDSEDVKLIKERNNKNYKIINVYDNNKKIIDKMILYYDEEDYETSDAVKLYFDALLKHPVCVINSYINGYLATTDVYFSVRAESGIYYPERIFSYDFNHENRTIGLSYLLNDNNFLWLNDQNIQRVSNLHSDINIPKRVTNIVLKYSNIHFVTFKLFFIILPFVVLYLIYKLLKKGTSKKLEITLILLGFALLHTLFHVVTGAIIDRYIYIVFPEIVLGYLLLLSKRNNDILDCRKEVKKMLNKKEKSIFVIPAYNESKHIADVINDIRKTMPESDIIITNDCSKDNTREIVEDLGVPCLNVPFNMGYAMAVQTGIKYAYENGYDYVIQFDADGQHLASEVKKLFKKMKETKANIVIGSRFLEKTGYKHPFFRKVGTKMFSTIIKIFCKKKITDPTSGFQLLDRSVVERYAQMGKYPEFPDANLIIEMLIEGYKINEVAVKMKECNDGVSMHGGIIKPIKYMINVTYTIVFILIRGFSFRRDK